MAISFDQDAFDAQAAAIHRDMLLTEITANALGMTGEWHTRGFVITGRAPVRGRKFPVKLPHIEVWRPLDYTPHSNCLRACLADFAIDYCSGRRRVVASDATNTVRVNFDKREPLVSLRRACVELVALRDPRYIKPTETYHD